MNYTEAVTGVGTVALNGDAGDDLFYVNANTPAGVTTRLNGGAGNDSFTYAAGAFRLTGGDRRREPTRTR